MPTKTIPAVSIIIPMYNTEKYIGECLDSILAQTFQDFEVIIVDDCSTDNSAAIVESYLPKFNAKGGGGKLQLIRSEKNSDTPGMPRNVGLRYSRGEYIMFVDSDDAITKTALEEIYPIAKKFDADVLYCEKCYRVGQGDLFSTDKNFLKNPVVMGNINYNYVSEPTLVYENIAERIKDFLALRFYVVPWNYLIRKDLISKYEIKFPNVKYGEDNMFVLFLICLAKNMVRVPNTIYVHRVREGSIGTNKSPEIEIHRCTDHVFQGITIISNFSKEVPFLRNHPEFQYALFNFLANNQFGSVAPLYAQIPAWQLDPFIRRELDKIDDKTPLTAFLFSRMTLFNLQLHQQGTIIQQMNAHIQKQNQVIQQLQAQIKSLQAK